MKKYIIGIGVLTILCSFFYFQEHKWSPEELVGKKRPQLEGEGFNLRPQAAKAFAKMQEAASQEGVNIYSVSSYRDFNRQKGIWERKWARYQAKGLRGEAIAQEIIKYSTIPGTSRHHWGTDLDVIDLNVKVVGDKLLARHFDDNGAYEKLHYWLSKNANSYGFYLVYTNEASRKGFEYEPWHLTYLPLSKDMYKAYLKVDWKKELKGVKGIDQLSDNFFLKYQKEQIEGINPILK